MGPGTKLPTLGHTTFAAIRDAYQQNAEGLLAGGADALLVETTQDLLQTKASVIAARRAMEIAGHEVPLIVSVTVETTGTMLLGSEIGAALTALEPLGIDMVGLNCATGPAEMSEHLRYLARHSRIQLSCMPNAGLPELTKDGARYPLSPGSWRTRRRTSSATTACPWSAAAAVRRPSICGSSWSACTASPRRSATRARNPVRPPLPDRPLPAGHLLPGDRRADQRQRVEEVP